jgi:hypothetical protein
VGAVCGVFLGEPGGGLVGQLQRNEYFRYARLIKRRWQALVLSGTGTLFRVPVLKQIARERGNRLPGTRGQIYNQASITEDDEVTLAVKTLGWKCLCPPECETTTEVMPTWKALWTQRIRWQKGTLGDLRAYGLGRVTRSYWARQTGLYGGFAVSFVCLGIMLPGTSHPRSSPVRQRRPGRCHADRLRRGRARTWGPQRRCRAAGRCAYPAAADPRPARRTDPAAGPGCFRGRRHGFLPACCGLREADGHPSWPGDLLQRVG